MTTHNASKILLTTAEPLTHLHPFREPNFSVSDVLDAFVAGNLAAKSETPLLTGIDWLATHEFETAEPCYLVERLGVDTLDEAMERVGV